MNYGSPSQMAADISNGLPLGTTYNLALTESSNGTNLGSIGNTYQIEPGTASNPGYGITGTGSGPGGSLDGNNPNDAAKLVAAYTSNAGGDLGAGLAAYHGGPSNPVPYSGSSAIGNFLNWLTNTGNTIADAKNPGGTPSASGGKAGIPPGALGSPSQDGGTSPYFWYRAAVAIVAFLLLAIGLSALALKTDVTSVLAKVKGQ